MSGWYASDAAKWPGRLARLRLIGPLEEDDAREDLRYLEDQVRLWLESSGTRGRRWPGRAELRHRWGWATDWSVRSLVAADDWHDPTRPVAFSDLMSTVSRAPNTRANQSSPSGRQVAAKSPPSEQRANADNDGDSAKSPPSRRQVAAKSPPSRVPLFTGSPITDHRETFSAPAGAEAASTGPPVESEEIPAIRSPKSRKSPGYTEAIAAFDEEHRSIRGTKYPWVFTGRESDATRVKTWLQAAQVATDRPGEGVARIRGAARAYLRAVEAGAAWPHGEPASTRHFTREIARWLQVDPEAQPTGPPGGASPPRGSKTSRVDAALAEAQRRLAERRSSSSNHTKETDLAIP